MQAGILGGEHTCSPHSEMLLANTVSRLRSHRPGQSFAPGGVESLLPRAKTLLALFQQSQI